jgi:hypothetical protein
MAVNITLKNASLVRKTYDIEATADADVNAVLAHNFALVDPDADLRVTIEPLAAASRVSQWIVSVRDANNLTLAKGIGAGSGAAGVQLRVHVEKVHTIVK